MSDFMHGKFLRTDTVVGIVYSPEIEDFFRGMADGTETMTLMPQGRAELYDVGRANLDDIGLDMAVDAPLRDRHGNVNLHFLRAVGLGNANGFEDPITAISKFYPEGSENHNSWLEYAVSQGFERQSPPPPPGLVFRADGKYSNSALEDILAQTRETGGRIYREFIEPVELEFEVTIDTNS